MNIEQEKMVVESLSSLYPLKSYEREWIGTKRFGTTISDEVYVTFENQKGERFCKHIRFQNEKLSPADQHIIDTLYKGSKPIAWRPLPETYHEEVTE